jgi:GNAT superfamily N-acetyltransferase
MIFNFKSIKKPKYKLVVKEAEKYLWPQFHEHHYMTANKSIIDSLPRSSKFFTFYWVRNNEEILIGCLGVLNQVSKYPARRITRLVVLPEFQGLGFSKLMLNSISELYLKEKITMYITTFHPGLGNFFEKSNAWEPSANNMKEFKSLKDKELSSDISEHPFEESLRDGVAMFRYHYVGNTNYSLDYNPLKLEDLLEQAKGLDDNDKEYKKIKRKIQALKRKQDPNYKEEKPKELLIDDPEHIKAKSEHKYLFKKNKRKVLSTSERNALRAEKKEKLIIGDFDEF